MTSCASRAWSNSSVKPACPFKLSRPASRPGCACLPPGRRIRARPGRALPYAINIKRCSAEPPAHRFFEALLTDRLVFPKELPIDKQHTIRRP